MAKMDSTREPTGLSEQSTVESPRGTSYETGRAERKRLVTTFYSFKGGVGRSQALCAVGRLLSRRRRTALLVDVDLEAPGLSLALLDKDVIATKLGVLDILGDLAAMLLNAYEGHAELPSDLVQETAQRIAENVHAIPPEGGDEEPELLRRIRADFPQIPFEERKGALLLLSCGRIFEDYTGATGRLRLGELLQRNNPEKLTAIAPAAGFGPNEAKPQHLLQVLVRVFHDALLACELPANGSTRPADYVLVDSRAGLADIGGFCVRGLADHLVVLSGLNRQNLSGTRMVIRRLEEARRRAGRLTVVLSPVPDAEVELLDKRVKEARRILDLRRDPLLLHYHPRLALIEECFVEPKHRHTQLSSDYAALCLRLQEVHDDTWQTHAQNALPILRSEVTDAEARNAVSEAIEASVLSPQEAAGAMDSLCDVLEKQRALHAGVLDLFRLRAALRPDHVGSWGTLSQELGAAAALVLRNGDADGAEALTEECLQRYERALSLEDDPARTHASSASSLSEFATALWDAGREDEAKARYEEAFTRYARAVEIKPDKHKALNNWGNALGQLAGRQWDAGRHDEAAARYEEAREKCLQAERLQAGSGAYNLACVEALSGNADAALEWLEKALRAHPELAAHARSDEDLESLRELPRFRAITDRATHQK